MIMTKWQAIVFDLDDTLYPESAYVLSGFRAVSQWAEKNLDIPFKDGFSELKELFEKGVRGDTFNQWLKRHGIDRNTVVSEMVMIYRNHNPEIEPFPCVPNLLSSLQKKYKLGLISDGYLSVQQQKLKALGLGKYFDSVIFPDYWGREYWKPNTRPFNTAIQELKVLPFHAIYVGDNPDKDFLGARKIGMYTIQIRKTAGEYSKLPPLSYRHAPDLVINSFDHFESRLADLEKL